MGTPRWRNEGGVGDALAATDAEVLLCDLVLLKEALSKRWISPETVAAFRDMNDSVREGRPLSPKQRGWARKVVEARSPFRRSPSLGTAAKEHNEALHRAAALSRGASRREPPEVSPIPMRQRPFQADPDE